jgi:hypothetical protein
VSQPEDADAIRDEAAGAVYYEYARWLLDWHWRRADAYERKASQILAFVGLVLALLPTAVDPIHRLASHSTHSFCAALAVTSAVSLGLAALASACSLWRRPVAGPPLDPVQASFRRHDDGAGPSAATLTNRVSVAMYGTVEAPTNSPLVALARDARIRGRWFQAAALSMSVAVLLLSVLLTILVLASSQKG